MKNEQDNKSNTDNLLIAIFASALAPLISRLIHLYIADENGIWSTENILVIYLSSVVGFVISDKLYRVVENSRLYEKGVRLGDSDTVRFAIWLCPVVLSTQLKSKIAVIGLIAITILSVVILVKDIGEIQIRMKQLCMIAVFTIAAILLGIHNMSLEMYLMYFFGIIIVVIVIDVCKAIVKRLKE